MKPVVVTIGVLSLDIVEIKWPIEEMVSTVETAKVVLDHKSTNLVWEEKNQTLIQFYQRYKNQFCCRGRSQR